VAERLCSFFGFYGKRKDGFDRRGCFLFSFFKRFLLWKKEKTFILYCASLNPKWSNSTTDDAHKRNEINKIEPAFARFCAAHARVSRQFNPKAYGELFWGMHNFIFLSFFFVSGKGDFFPSFLWFLNVSFFCALCVDWFLDDGQNFKRRKNSNLSVKT